MRVLTAPVGTAITFLLIGLGVGAAVGLLLAPKTGRQLRKDLRRSYDDVLETASDWTDEAKDRFDEVVEKGADFADEVRAPKPSRSATCCGARKTALDNSSVVDRQSPLAVAARAKLGRQTPAYGPIWVSSSSCALLLCTLRMTMPDRKPEVVLHLFADSGSLCGLEVVGLQPQRVTLG